MYHKFSYVISIYIKIMKKREKLDDFNNHQNHHFYGYNLP